MPRYITRQYTVHRTLLAATLLFACALLVTMASGCESGDSSEVRIDRPLRFDPTEDYELSQWWTNGRVMLHLRSDLSYALYEGTNRYHAPVERGQWRQRNYARLEFRRYAASGQYVEQVLLDKDSKGNLVMIIDDDIPLGPISQPPEVLEDSLLGRWSGDEFAVELFSNGRYSYDRLGALASGISGHRGNWSLDRLTLTITPGPANLEPMSFEVTVQDNAITLEGLEGE